MIQPSCVLRLSTGASSLPASLPDLIRCHPQPYRNALQAAESRQIHPGPLLYTHSTVCTHAN